MNLVLAASLLVLASGMQNQERAVSEPTVLKAAGSRTLGVPDISADDLKCEGTGHVFYRLTRPDFSMNDSIVMKLDLKSETPTLFEQPSDYLGKANLIDFSVTPSGRVWYLDEMKEGGAHVAVGYDSDGKDT